jgi:hypothetical protein
MNTNESRTAWIVAGVLLILLIIVGYLWLSQKQDLNTVLQNGKTDIAAARDQITKDCQGPNMDADACKADLNDLAGILSDFSADVQAASTTTAQ